MHYSHMWPVAAVSASEEWCVYSSEKVQLDSAEKLDHHGSSTPIVLEPCF